MTKKPVFCSECRHFSGTDHASHCGALITYEKDWYEKYSRSPQPHIQNANNDCKAWQHKRGLIEWLIDVTARN